MPSLTGITDRISRADLERILDRIAELRELDRLMRQPGTLAAPRRTAPGDTAKDVPDSAET